MGASIGDKTVDRRAAGQDRREARAASCGDSHGTVEAYRTTFADLPPAGRTPSTAVSRGRRARRCVANAALRARYLSRDDVPEDIVASERRIAEETARAEASRSRRCSRLPGEGRLNGFFKDALEQASVSDNKRPSALLDVAGGDGTRFVQFEVGQA